MIFDGPLLPVVVIIRMRQPIREIRRQALRFRRFQHGIPPQGQNLRPPNGVAARFQAPPHGVFRQTRGPRFVEPLLERTALVRPAVVIIRRRHVRADARQVRWLGDRRKELRRTHVRPAKHAHFSIGIRQGGGPFDGVVTVLRFIFEGIPLALRFKAPAHILRNHRVPARRCPQPESHAPRLVVGRAHQQHRKFAFGFWPVNVGSQSHPIAHLRRHISLHRDVVVLRSRRCQRQDQRHPHHGHREQSKTPHAIIAASHFLLHRYASTLCPALVLESAPSLGRLLTAVKRRLRKETNFLNVAMLLVEILQEKNSLLTGACYSKRFIFSL